MSYRVTTEPSEETLDLGEAKDHLRYSSNDADREIEALVKVARGKIENWEWRAHITQTITLSLDAFPFGKSDVIYLPRPRLQSITSVAYVDADGEAQTLDAADYQVDVIGEPGRLRPSYSNVWPVARGQFNAVTIVYAAGYGDQPEDVPSQTRHATKLLLAHFWRNREAVTDIRLQEAPLAVQALLLPVYDERILECV